MDLLFNIVPLMLLVLFSIIPLILYIALLIGLIKLFFWAKKHAIIPKLEKKILKALE